MLLLLLVVVVAVVVVVVVVSITSSRVYGVEVMMVFARVLFSGSSVVSLLCSTAV